MVKEKLPSVNMMNTNLKVVVLGSENVGKTALSVRYLTKRFIGEYQSDTDSLYNASIELDDSPIQLQLLDCTEIAEIDDVLGRDQQLQWADAFIVVYDICNRDSFLSASKIIKSIRSVHSHTDSPILLIGNKLDLQHRRQTGFDEGHVMSLDQTCQFYELSAADGYHTVTHAFNSLFREAKVNKKALKINKFFKSNTEKRRNSFVAKIGDMFRR
ncbi:unnamed protein product [Owenia fusiformis]|uniref:small monomeric GTPase n=1 Tax=Owenia fusiformis TaxID=6347 RepID=A0A8S4NB54_OWEFU|nr:unnamed protein product [Owenia fusiformis]